MESQGRSHGTRTQITQTGCTLCCTNNTHTQPRAQGQRRHRPSHVRRPATKVACDVASNAWSSAGAALSRCNLRLEVAPPKFRERNRASSAAASMSASVSRTAAHVRTCSGPTKRWIIQPLSILFFRFFGQWICVPAKKETWGPRLPAGTAVGRQGENAQASLASFNATTRKHARTRRQSGRRKRTNIQRYNCPQQQQAPTGRHTLTHAPCTHAHANTDIDIDAAVHTPVCPVQWSINHQPQRNAAQRNATQRAPDRSGIGAAPAVPDESPRVYMGPGRCRPRTGPPPTGESCCGGPRAPFASAVGRDQSGLRTLAVLRQLEPPTETSPGLSWC